MDSFPKDLKFKIHKLSYLRKIGLFISANQISAKYSVSPVDFLCYWLTIAEFSEEDLPNFSISLDLFNYSNANERFTSLPEGELTNLTSKNQNQNTSKGTKT